MHAMPTSMPCCRGVMNPYGRDSSRPYRQVLPPRLGLVNALRERNTTTNSVDFPTWFSFGCYSGLACCMFAIAVNALYTTLRKRGTTRQLAGAIVTCVTSALLLLLALAWYDMRFSIEQAVISVAEVEVVLVYVALFGWFLPL